MAVTNWRIPSPLAKREHFVFLRILRDGGAINMYGAGEHLEDEFNLTKSDARIILREWMKNPEG